MSQAGQERTLPDSNLHRDLNEKGQTSPALPYPHLKPLDDQLSTKHPRLDRANPLYSPPFHPVSPVTGRVIYVSSYLFTNPSTNQRYEKI
jgi:hypothetical protein